MSNRKSVTIDSPFDAAIERVIRGEPDSGVGIDEGELRAARFLTQSVPDFLPSAQTRERALRAVRERVAANPEPRAWWRFGPVQMPALPLRALPIAVVLLVGVLVGGAYALPVVLPWVFGANDPSAVEILQSGRAQELHLSQTAAGVTITADRAYADAHRIVVQFTVQNPPADPGQSVKTPVTTGGSVTLTDSAGRTYRHIRGVESPLISGAVWNGEALVAVYSFDASQIPANADHISFNLAIAELRGVPIQGPGARLPGPWIFTFAVPVSR